MIDDLLGEFMEDPADMKHKKLPLIVSVDYSFFVVSDPYSRWPLNETPAGILSDWLKRVVEWGVVRDQSAQEVLPLRGPLAEDFAAVIKRVGFSEPYMGPGLSEFHSKIVTYLDKLGCTGPVDIISFDSNHNTVFPGEVAAHKTAYDSNTWVGHLLANDRIGSYTVVYPDWRKVKELREVTTAAAFELVRDPRVGISYWSEFVAELRQAPRKLAGLFICRSGDVVPPCYDEAFNHLLRRITDTDEGLQPRPFMSREAIQEEIDKLRQSLSVAELADLQQAVRLISPLVADETQKPICPSKAEA